MAASAANDPAAEHARYRNALFGLAGPVTRGVSTLGELLHTELSLRSLSPRRTDDNDEASTVVNQKGLRDRIEDDRARLTFQGTFGTETVDLRQAHRHYFPWITETLTQLSKPRSRTELKAVAEQWRNERVKYVYDNPQNANITIATTA